MGGYAFYVWGSYLITAVMIAGEVVAVLRRRKSLPLNGSEATQLKRGIYETPS